MSDMQLSPAGLNLIKRLEGCSTVAYQDVVGLWTIGVGHLLTRSELMSGKILLGGTYVKWGNGLTPTQCDELLTQDTGWAVNAIQRLITSSLKQNQFDALVSFVFNVGENAFRDSTLRKRVDENKGDDAVCEQFMRWTKAGGKDILGLKNRRVFECKMWRGEL